MTHAHCDRAHARRTTLLLAGALPFAVVAVLLVAAATGGAQAPGARTLTLFQDESHGSFDFVDIPPKSPTSNLQSPKLRLSVGDTIDVVDPARDRPGGARLGTFYGEVTVVSGTTLANAVVLGRGAFSLGNGQIIVAAAFRPGQKTTGGAVIGGTGAYAGARGSETSTNKAGGALWTFHLLP